MIPKKLRLDQILLNRNLAESKSKAQAIIMAGQVFVDGIKINKSGYNIKSDSLFSEKVTKGNRDYKRLFESKY